VTRKTSTADRHCWWCGDELDEGLRSDRLYCSEPHKEAAQRLRRDMRKRIEAGEPHDRKWRVLLANPTHPAWQGIFREHWEANASAREKAAAAWEARELERYRKAVEEHRKSHGMT
jgi:hypothetical protein